MPRLLRQSVRSWTVLLPVTTLVFSLVIWISYSKRASIRLRMHSWCTKTEVGYFADISGKQTRTTPIQWGYLYEPEHPMALKPESLMTLGKDEKTAMTTEESLAADPSLYFMYLPKGGLTNQMMEFWKAIIIANRLDRTLIYPPMLASLHDTGKHTQSWADYFDMDYLLSRVPKTRLIQIEEAPSGLLPQQMTLLRKDNIMGLGMTARRLCLLYEWECDRDWVSLELEDTPSLDRYIEALESATGGKKSQQVPLPLLKDGKGGKAPMVPYTRKMSDQDKLVVVTPLLKIHSPRDWADVGRYMRFNGKVVSLAQKMVQNIAGDQEFIAVHWRRSDFDEYCQTFAKPRQKHCWPKIETAMALIIDIRKQELQHVKGILPVIITTNTQDAHELDVIRDQPNVHILVHDERSDLGVFGKAMVDTCVPTLSNARIFIGNSFSTFSKMAAKRRQAWNRYPSKRVKGKSWKEMPGRVVYF